MSEKAIDFECGRSENGIYKMGYDSRYPLSCALVDIKKKKAKWWDFTKNERPEDVFEYIIKEGNKEAKRNKNTTIFAYNMNYDATILLRGNYTNSNIKRISHKPFIYSVLCDDRKHEIRLIDAQGYFGGSLEKLGEALGKRKLEMPKEIKEVEELREYNIQDAKIVIEAINEVKKLMKKEFNYRIRKWTSLPTLAKNLQITICNKEEYEKANGNKSRKASWWYFNGSIVKPKNPELALMSSRGGRFEQIAKKDVIYKGNIKKLDICATYPYVCCENERYPFMDLMTEKRLRDEELDERIIKDKEKYQLGVIEATLKSPDVFLPYLPIRYKGVEIFPKNCIMKAVWTLFEIREAVEKYGYKLLEIHQGVYFKKLPFSMFSGFYKKLFEIKKRTESEVFKRFIKNISNTVTGKFGARVIPLEERNREEKIRLRDFVEYQVKGYEAIADCGDGNIIIRIPPKEKVYAKYSNGFVYSHITAYARSYLYEHALKIVNENPEDLLYLSCDAITFKDDEDKHIRNFSIGNEMGQWKIEDEGREFEGFNEQYYRIDEKIKASGITKRDVNIEAIRKGHVKTSSMYTIKLGIRTGKFEEIGSFPEKIMNLKKNPKRYREYPDIIEEIPKSRMLNMMEEVKKVREENKLSASI